MKNNSSRLENLMEKGSSYCDIKDYNKAIDCFDKVLQIHPKYINALNNKGNAYYNLKEY